MIRLEVSSFFPRRQAKWHCAGEVMDEGIRQEVREYVRHAKMRAGHRLDG